MTKLNLPRLPLLLRDMREREQTLRGPDIRIYERARETKECIGRSDGIESK